MGSCFSGYHVHAVLKGIKVKVKVSSRGKLVQYFSMTFKKNRRCFPESTTTNLWKAAEVVFLQWYIKGLKEKIRRLTPKNRCFRLFTQETVIKLTLLVVWTLYRNAFHTQRKVDRRRIWTYSLSNKKKTPVVHLRIRASVFPLNTPADDRWLVKVSKFFFSKWF